MNTCYDLTVDICVLMSGSNIGNKNYLQPSRTLMKTMKSKKKFFLAVDKKEKILKQYLKNLKQGTYGHQWIREMAEKNKIKVIPWIYINRGIKSALGKARFPVKHEDFNYVVTAAGTNCKFLVSHDPDFYGRASIVLRRKLGIRIKAACECHDL